MTYTVQPGDSLWRIAWKELGSPDLWPEIAKLNHLQSPDRLLVGQHLFMPLTATHTSSSSVGLRNPLHSSASDHYFEKRSPLLPITGHVFIIADEWDPFRRKFVRKIAYPTKPLTPEEIARIIKPEKHGIAPRDPHSNVSMGRHVGLNRTDSKFISASEGPLGSPRFEGNRYWIDAAKAEAAGVKIHENAELIRDLDRVLAKEKDPARRAKMEAIRKLSISPDREVLLEGHIPAGAVKGAAAMSLTRGLQVVEGVGVVMTVYDLGKAGQQSYQQKSVVPLAKETVRQAGGWGGAWAGAEFGGAVGAAFGIETGPGAVLTGAAGALIFGTAGFFGADWAVRKIGGGH